MYGNKNESQRVEAGARGGASTTIATADNLPTCKLVTDGKRTWPVDENGKPLGIYTKSLVAPSKRVHDFILQDQSCKLLPNIVFVIV